LAKAAAGIATFFRGILAKNSVDFVPGVCHGVAIGCGNPLPGEGI
jgi:hypothetical protein